MIYSLLIADVIMIAATALSYSRLPPQIPLFYTHTWGEEQLADIWFIAIIPLFMHLFFFLNNWIRNRFLAKESFLYKLFNTCNTFLVISFTIVYLKIILLVI